MGCLGFMRYSQATVDIFLLCYGLVQQGRQADKGLETTPEPVNMYRAEIEEFSLAILEDDESAYSGMVIEIWNFL